MRKIIVVVLSFCLVAFSPGVAWAFSDTYQHWANIPINHLAARGLVYGRSADRFDPQAPVTRAEFATMLVNGLGLGKEAQALKNGVCFFKDVSPAYWAKGSLELCRELGIMVPDRQGRCYPNRTINRAEAATMVAQALPLKGPGVLSFADQDEIPSWASEPVGLACRSEILKGFPDGTFRPYGLLTRAEAVVIMENVLGFWGDKYHGTGTLQTLNLPLRKAVIRVEGRTYNFDLANQFAFYPLAQQGSLNLPLPCYFDVNDEGDLVFIREIEREESAWLQITARKAPGNDGLRAAYPGIAVLGERKDEANEPNLAQQGAGVPVDLAEVSGDANRLLVLFEAGEVVNKRLNPRLSSELNAREVRARDLQANLGVDGRGVRVAVIDTGVDPGHPDLMTNPDGSGKIVDWLDLTEEGKVMLTATPVVDGRLKLPDTDLDLGAGRSLSGRAYYGYLEVNRLPVRLRLESQSRILLVALDTRWSGVYDTVLVDTNGDGLLDDEKPLSGYGLKREYGSLVTTDDKPFNFVISSLDRSGKWVRLGFDASGHGTKVAGVLAGNGLMQGIAPGAEIVAIKVGSGFGNRGVEELKSAIRLLPNLGVKVANISLGFAELSATDRVELEGLIAEASSQQGITFCIAAGNLGPGLSTLVTPAGTSGVMAAGGCLTPDMWSTYYGWRVAQPTLWYFSSIGPDDRGAVPLVMAPACGTSTGARWIDDYSFNEGTSIASPAVAGGVALLIEAAQKEGIKTSPELLRQAIAGGADSLPGYLPCEAGYGALNLAGAWEVLRASSTYPMAAVQGEKNQGLYLRQYLPAGSYLGVTNKGNTARIMELTTGADWVKLSQERMQVPSRGSRSLELIYDSPEKPGLYSTWVLGDDPDTRGVDLEVLQTVVVPFELKGAGAPGVVLTGQLPAGMYQRYFFKVPEGNGKLSIKVTVPRDSSGNYQGRVRLHLMGPDGQVAESTGYAGSGYPDSSAHEYLEVTKAYPAPGVWEVVLYSSVALSQYGLDHSKFTVETSLMEWENKEPSAADQTVFITSVASVLKAGEESWITLHFWDPISTVPLKGQVVINDRLYEIRDGKVRLKITPDEGPVILKVAV